MAAGELALAQHVPDRRTRTSLGRSLGKPVAGERAALLSGLGIDDILTVAATRLDPVKAAGKSLSFDLAVAESGEQYMLELSHGVLIHARLAKGARGAIPVTKADLIQALFVPGAIGTPDKLTALASMLDTPNTAFPIVTAIASGNQDRR